MGMSGITANALVPLSYDRNGRNARNFWTWSFISGVTTVGTFCCILKPSVFGSGSSPAAELSPVGTAVAGLLTGFGTRMGSGCTSGHGICGLPRRSVRSLTAVLTFISSGALCTYGSRVFRDKAAALFASSGCSELVIGVLNAETFPEAFRPALYLLGGTFLAMRLLSSKRKVDSVRDLQQAHAPKHIYNEPSIGTHLTSFSCGALFCLGLAIGGMTDPSRVQGFLDFLGPSGWDPTLMGVMGGGVLTNLFTFEWMRRRGNFDNHKSFKFDSHPRNTLIDFKLLGGAALFGCGWGLSGVCPGPAIASLPGALLKGLNNGAMVLFVPAMLLGMAVQELV